MGEGELRVKKSRFDQTSPEPKRQSRFDRRSRSPSTRQTDHSARQRSPVNKESRSHGADGKKKVASDPAAAAAAAAAKINAQIQAKKGIVDANLSVPLAPSPSPAPSASVPENAAADVYVTDGDFIKDIEVNNLRNRYTLTKGSTQRMIKDETGADVTTRGSYLPDKSMATATNPPLYLHITSTTKEGLDKAVQKIEELMKQELPNLVDERRFRRRDPEPIERDEFGRRKWPEEHVRVGLDPIPGFNLRAQVVGQGGAYVKHIQQETRCRVQIKGRGSGFTEHGTGKESDEPMFLHVTGPDMQDVQRAKDLCEDLLANVKNQYERFKEQSLQRVYGSGLQRDRHHDYGSLSPCSHAPQRSVSTPGPNTPDYGAQYTQYYGAADPYAAYGGYQNYIAYYQYYQQASQQLSSNVSPGSNEAPPPPPPGNGSLSVPSDEYRTG